MQAGENEMIDTTHKTDRNIRLSQQNRIIANNWYVVELQDSS